MTEQERELLLQLAKKCIDLELRVLALNSLLKAKKTFTDAELARALKTVSQTREDFARRADQSPDEMIEEMLRNFQGTKQ